MCERVLRYLTLERVFIANTHNISNCDSDPTVIGISLWVCHFDISTVCTLEYVVYCVCSLV